MRRLVAFGMALALCACATARLATPTGKPDVEVTGMSRLQARDALAANLVANGWTLRSSTDYSIVAEREGGMLESILMGSRFNPITVRRITYNLVDVPGGVRIVANVGIVTNPGSGFEKVSDMTDGKWGHQLHAELVTFRDSHAPVRGTSAGDVQLAASPVLPSAPASRRPAAGASSSPAGGPWEQVMVARSGAIEGMDAGSRVRILAPGVSRTPIEGVVVGWRADTVFVGYVERAGVWTVPLAAIKQASIERQATVWREVPLPTAGGKKRRP